MAPTSVSYEEIAQSRPRIRRDVLFTRTPTGVLFHNAYGGFNVVTASAYRFASALVPHLDGRQRVAELCAGLGEKQRGMVVQLVAALYARGFARDATESAPVEVPPAVAERFAHQLDYLDHYSDGAAERFLRFRSTAVCVLGDDAVARWAAVGLLRNGCAAVAVTETGSGAGVLRPELHGVSGTADVEAEAQALGKADCAPRLDRLPAPAAGTYGWADLDGWDTVLVTGGPGGYRQILRLLCEGVPDGRRLLASWTFGNRAVVGPVMTAGTPGCWSCATLRLGAAGEAADSAELWAAAGPAAPLGTAPPTVAGPLAGMLGNLLAFEVFRLTTGAPPAETGHQIIVQDLDSLDVLTEPLLPHPRCPFCAPAQDTAEVAYTPGTLHTADAADEAPAPPADGAADQDAARAALAELELRDVLVHPAAGVFTGYADDDWDQTPLKVSTVRLGTGPGRVREISAADVHHVAGARMAALLRAAEVYADHVVPPRVVDAADERRRIAPAALALSTGLDVPAEQVAHWSAATSLLDGRRVLVPTAAVRTLGPYNEQDLFERTPAGTGAGATPRAALTRALRTALTRDALSRAVHRTAPVTTVDPQSLTGQPELLFLQRAAEILGADTTVLDLTAAGGHTLPIVLARHTDPESGTVRWAAGSGLRLGDAVREALQVLLGAEQLRRATGEPDTGDPLWGDLDVTTLVAEGTARLADTATTWGAVLDAVATAGRDVLVVPVHAPDLAAGELYTVRTLLTRGEHRAR
ncbi:TOMM precursor leader peptide-binding protein [Streptomyces sp. NPDC058045]|uniref:TOMM precursor leader peptide-binding protein n=1 Tax=Streptomyces sp. NPDC058045 TaxID=3346311 RepID=UPI0036E02077